MNLQVFSKFANYFLAFGERVLPKFLLRLAFSLVSHTDVMEYHVLLRAISKKQYLNCQ